MALISLKCTCVFLAIGSSASFCQSPPAAVLTDVKSPDPHAVSPEVRAARARFFDSAADILPPLESVGGERDVHYFPASLPELPVGEADAVFVGTIADAACFPSTSHSAIYTEMEFRVTKAFKGNPATSVQLLMEGGALVFPTGPVSQVGSGQGLPLEVGQTYLLFAMRMPGDETAMRPLKAWKISSGKLSPTFSRDVEAAKAGESTVDGKSLEAIYPRLTEKQ